MFMIAQGVHKFNLSKLEVSIMTLNLYRTQLSKRVNHICKEQVHAKQEQALKITLELDQNQVSQKDQSLARPRKVKK